jgi:DNA-directed RNA polymerase subunit F
MTQEEIIEMARQAGVRDDEHIFEFSQYKYLEVFAKLVAEKEREACAKICDLAMLQNQEAINELENDEHIAKCFIESAMNQLVKTAKAIRARGKA